jgi:hypothetical protein
MLSMSPRIVFGRLLASYTRWAAESHGRLAQITKLFDDARAHFDAARTLRADRLPWCSRCGERLRVRDEVGARGNEGIHARGYGA